MKDNINLSEIWKVKVKSLALTFLKSNNVMSVASASIDCEPHTAIVYYTIDEDFNVYFMTSRGSKKYNNLKQNNKIAFTINSNKGINAIQGGGIAEELNEVQATTFFKLINNLIGRDLFRWPLMRLAEEGYCTFKIKPTWMVWFNLDKENYPEISSDRFYKII